jgi:hypothetical protein
MGGWKCWQCDRKATREFVYGGGGAWMPYCDERGHGPQYATVGDKPIDEPRLGPPPLVMANDAMEAEIRRQLEQALRDNTQLRFLAAKAVMRADDWQARAHAVERARFADAWVTIGYAAEYRQDPYYNHVTDRAEENRERWRSCLARCVDLRARIQVLTDTLRDIAEMFGDDGPGDYTHADLERMCRAALAKVQ